MCVYVFVCTCTGKLLRGNGVEVMMFSPQVQYEINLNFGLIVHFGDFGTSFEVCGIHVPPTRYMDATYLGRGTWIWFL